MMLDLLGFQPATTPQARGAGRRRQRMISGLTAATLMLASASGSWAAAAGILHLRCTNAASGASWLITVDLDHSQVDSLAATITDEWINWRDPKQGIFELERATGKLQFRNASSTGGYFLYYTCRQG
jgi:hypothetical protein